MSKRLTRRQAMALAAGAVQGAASLESIRARMPSTVAPGVAAILARILSQQPSEFNTDWFGTMPMLGALLWGRRGIAEAGPFAKAWLDHHLRTKEVSKYGGARSRTVWAGGVPLTTYAGHFGISLVCEEMVRQSEDERAKRICLDVAEIILHRTARNSLGLVGHDDVADFAIPDVTFFAVSSLMIAAALDRKRGWVYRDQAVYQLRTAIDTFLMKETGLAKTLYRGGRVGDTYWTRASGWLLWAMTAMLRRLPSSDSSFAGFASDLQRLVEGMTKVQDPSGGFHVLLDDVSTPLDATGPAMFALGVHEAARRGWLPASYTQPAQRAWMFVERNLSSDGTLRNTYYLWALPAENRDRRLRDETSGWAMGFVLAAAEEISRP